MPSDFSKIDEKIYFTSVLIHFIFSTIVWLYYEVAKPYFVSNMSDFEQFFYSMLCGYLISIFYLSVKGVIIDHLKEKKTE